MVKLAWELFDTIAHATLHSSLYHAVKQASDRLAPIRRAKEGTNIAVREESLGNNAIII